MAKLTEAEKRILVGAANRGFKYVTGKRMLPQHQRELFAVVSELKNSEKPVIGKEAIALWAAKIDFAIANNDGKNASALISVKNPAALVRTGRIGPVALWDNGGCDCNPPSPSGW